MMKHIILAWLISFAISPTPEAPEAKCHSMMIGLYFPIADAQKDIIASDLKDKSEELSICPNLKKSCCDPEQLKKGKEQFLTGVKDLHTYKHFIKTYVKFFETLNDKALLKVFEAAWKAKDKKVTNEQMDVRLYDTVLQSFVYMATDRDQLLEAAKNTFKSDLKTLRSDLASWRPKTKKLIESLAKYYSGALCEICRPTAVSNVETTFSAAKKSPTGISVSTNDDTFKFRVSRKSMRYYNKIIIRQWDLLDSFGNLVQVARGLFEEPQVELENFVIQAEKQKRIKNIFKSYESMIGPYLKATGEKPQDLGLFTTPSTNIMDRSVALKPMVSLLHKFRDFIKSYPAVDMPKKESDGSTTTHKTKLYSDEDKMTAALDLKSTGEVVFIERIIQEGNERHKDSLILDDQGIDMTSNKIDKKWWEKVIKAKTKLVALVKKIRLVI